MIPRNRFLGHWLAEFIPRNRFLGSFKVLNSGPGSKLAFRSILRENYVLFIAEETWALRSLQRRSSSPRRPWLPSATGMKPHGWRGTLFVNFSSFLKQLWEEFFLLLQNHEISHLRVLRYSTVFLFQIICLKGLCHEMNNFLLKVLKIKSVLPVYAPIVFKFFAALLCLLLWKGKHLLIVKILPVTLFELLVVAYRNPPMIL